MMILKIIAVCMDESEPHISGTWTKCVRCSTKLFLSDSTVKNVLQQGYFREDIAPTCFACCLPDLKKLNPDKVMSLSDEQQKQISIGLKKYGL